MHPIARCEKCCNRTGLHTSGFLSQTELSTVSWIPVRSIWNVSHWRRVDKLESGVCGWLIGFIYWSCDQVILAREQTFVSILCYIVPTHRMHV